MYWIEEELEVEFEKTATKSHSEMAEYQVASTVEDVLTSGLETMTLEMGSLPGGTTKNKRYL